MGFGRALREARTVTSSAWRDPSDPWGGWPGDQYGPTWSGARVTPDTASQLLSVYGCVRMIADGVATLPVDSLRATDNGPVQIKRPMWLDMPAPDLDLDWISFATQVVSSLLLDGDAFIADIYSTETGKTVNLIPLEPCKVTVRLDGGRRVIDYNGSPISWDVLHIPAVMRPGALRGMSPVEAARQTIGLGMSAQEFAARFFGQGATMSGVIKVPGSMPPEGPGSPKEMAKAFARQHAGKSKAHLPAVLQGGADWVPTGVTQEQAQFLETRQFTDAQIAAQMFMLDPSELGIGVNGTSLTYANLEQRNIRFVQRALLPWIVRIEKALSALLARPQYIKINVNALLRGDTKTRYEAYAIGIKNEFLVPNEPRAWEDLSPLPGGDVVAKIAPNPPAPATDTGAPA